MDFAFIQIEYCEFYWKLSYVCKLSDFVVFILPIQRVNGMRSRRLACDHDSRGHRIGLTGGWPQRIIIIRWVIADGDNRWLLLLFDILKIFIQL